MYKTCFKLKSKFSSPLKMGENAIWVWIKGNLIKVTAQFNRHPWINWSCNSVSYFIVDVFRLSREIICIYQ